MSPIEERLHDLLDQAGVELVETGRLDVRYNACYPVSYTHLRAHET